MLVCFAATLFKRGEVWVRGIDITYQAKIVLWLHLTHGRFEIPADAQFEYANKDYIYDTPRLPWPFNIAIRPRVIGEHCSRANSENWIA